MSSWQCPECQWPYIGLDEIPVSPTVNLAPSVEKIKEMSRELQQKGGTGFMICCIMVAKSSIAHISPFGIPFLLSSLPLFVRAVQSVKRYADSKLYTHLINVSRLTDIRYTHGITKAIGW